MNYSVIGGRINGDSLYDQGRTLVHETGHHLGLFHTFAGCSACNSTYSSSDIIVDTPAEVDEYYECLQTHSCNSQDPIHNYIIILLIQYDGVYMRTGQQVGLQSGELPKLYNFSDQYNSSESGRAVIVPSILMPLLLG